MKRTSALAATGLMTILAMASCVSTPSGDSPQTGSETSLTTAAAPSDKASTGSEAAMTPEKTGPVRKERIEEFQVPVILKETITFADGIVYQITENTWSVDYTHILSSLTRKPSLPDPVLRTSYEYREGMLVSRSNHGPDGALLNHSTYDYDAERRLVRESLADGKGVIQSVSEWTWMEGRKSEWKVLDATGRILARTAYRYQDGRLSVLLMTDGVGNSTGRGEYQYNGEGRLIGIQYFSAAGIPQDRMEYVIEAGLLVQEKTFRADGRLERGVLYTYGPQGQIQKRTLTDASGRNRESTSFEYAFRTEKRTVFYYE